MTINSTFMDIYVIKLAKNWILEAFWTRKKIVKNLFLGHITIKTAIMEPLGRSLDEKNILISETLCWPWGSSPQL